MARQYSEEVARVLGRGNVKVGTDVLKARYPKSEIKIVPVKKSSASASDQAKGIVKNVKSQGTPQVR